MHVVRDGALPIAAMVGEIPEVDERFGTFGLETVRALKRAIASSYRPALNLCDAEIIEASIVHGIDVETVVRGIQAPWWISWMSRYAMPAPLSAAIDVESLSSARRK